MKTATFAKMAVMAGIVAAAFWGQPRMAHAEEPVNGRDTAPAICNGVSVLADEETGGLVAPEAEPAAGSRTDSEWKYVPIRRTASSETDTTNDDLDVIYDPPTDILPPAKPASDEEPTPAIDEMTGESEETEVVRIPITIKHGV